MQNNRVFLLAKVWVRIDDLKVRLRILYLEDLSYYISIMSSLYLVSAPSFIELLLTRRKQSLCSSFARQSYIGFLFW